MQKTQVPSLGGNIPWRILWLPTPRFLPGEFLWQRGLAGYSPWGHKELDMIWGANFFHDRGYFCPVPSISLCSVAQSCLSLCYAMDYSPPGSSVHRILQARIVRWVAISFSRESSWPKDRTWVSALQEDSLPLHHLGWSLSFSEEAWNFSLSMISAVRFWQMFCQVKEVYLEFIFMIECWILSNSVSPFIDHVIYHH